MKFKKIILPVLSLGLLSLALASCGGTDAKDASSNNTKVDTGENTGDTVEPEKNSWGMTKDASINGLKSSYNVYQKDKAKNDIEAANFDANSYNKLAEECKKTWKDFASLMKTEELPESLPIV